MLGIEWPTNDQRKPVKPSPMTSAMIMSMVRAETERAKNSF